MPGERNGQGVSTGVGVVALLSLALAGCGSSNLFSSSALDLFSTSSKATNSNASAGGDAVVAATDVECPRVEVRTGAATLLIGSKPGEGEPAALDVRYQGSIIRTARECQVNAGVMTMKIGVEGRVITGPAGGPGTVDVPLRIAVVKEGINPKAIVSKFARIPVNVTAAVDRVTFTHVDPEVTFPLPQPLADIDSYMVFVGFDPVAAQPEKKPPLKKKPTAKPRTVAKPKQS
jgi:hypothetical protein